MGETYTPVNGIPKWWKEHQNYFFTDVYSSAGSSGSPVFGGCLDKQKDRFDIKTFEGIVVAAGTFGADFELHPSQACYRWIERRAPMTTPYFGTKVLRGNSIPPLKPTESSDIDNQNSTGGVVNNNGNRLQGNKRLTGRPRKDQVSKSRLYLRYPKIIPPLRTNTIRGKQDLNKCDNLASSKRYPTSESTFYCKNSILYAGKNSQELDSYPLTQSTLIYLCNGDTYICPGEFDTAYQGTILESQSYEKHILLASLMDPEEQSIQILDSTRIEPPIPHEIGEKYSSIQIIGTADFTDELPLFKTNAKRQINILSEGEFIELKIVTVSNQKYLRIKYANPGTFIYHRTYLPEMGE